MCSLITQGIIIIQVVTFLAICQKLQKVWHFEIFLNTGPYAAGIFKVRFLPQFSLESTQTLWQRIVYHGKSKCLLEYCNEKLASSTWDNILFKTFQNILVYSVFSSRWVSRHLGLLIFNTFCGFVFAASSTPTGSRFSRNVTPVPSGPSGPFWFFWGL